MADSKISALPAITPPLGASDLLVAVQGGVTSQTTVANSGIAVYDANSCLPSLGISSTGRTNAGTITEVWVSLRTDSKAGSGSKEDPFDGSTQTKFDTLMGGFATNTIIHILPGIYSTKGNDGFQIKAGQRIYGSGRGVTTLKLSAYTAGSGSGKHYHFTTGSNTDGIELHDLTLDANYAAFAPVPSPNNHDAFGGVFITGNNLVAENVEIINCYGDATNGLEQFSLTLTGVDRAHQTTNNKIINCYTHSYAPGSNYTNGPSLAYCTNSLIMGCIDDGANHGFGFAGTTGCIMSYCATTANTATGWYNDTSFNVSCKIVANTFAASSLPMQFNVGTAGTNDIVISGNTFVSANNSSPGNAAAIYLSNSAALTNFRITDNHVIYTGSGDYTFIAAEAVNSDYSGFYIQGNSGSPINSVGLANGSNLLPATATLELSNFIGMNYFGTAPAYWSNSTQPYSYIRCTTATVVTNSTVMTTVTGCTTGALPPGTYRIEGFISMNPSSSQVATAQILATNTTTFNTCFRFGVQGGGQAVLQTQAVNASATTEGFISTAATASSYYGTVSGTIDIITDGTTLSWQFAQNPAAGAGNTLTVPFKGAVLTVIRVS
jgi:hypothetical protein